MVFGPLSDQSRDDCLVTLVIGLGVFEDFVDVPVVVNNIDPLVTLQRLPEYREDPIDILCSHCRQTAPLLVGELSRGRGVKQVLIFTIKESVDLVKIRIMVRFYVLLDGLNLLAENSVRGTELVPLDEHGSLEEEETDRLGGKALFPVKFDQVSIHQVIPITKFDFGHEENFGNFFDELQNGKGVEVGSLFDEFETESPEVELSDGGLPSILQVTDVIVELE